MAGHLEAIDAGRDDAAGAGLRRPGRARTGALQAGGIAFEAHRARDAGLDADQHALLDESRQLAVEVLEGGAQRGGGLRGQQGVETGRTVAEGVAAPAQLGVGLATQEGARALGRGAPAPPAW